MLKTLKLIGLLLFGLVLVLVYLGWRTPSLSANHGKLDTHLYQSDSINQPLVVAFGGGSGGNDWERNYLKSIRNQFLARGYAFLAIGYFKTEDTPGSLDRISLNAIADTILHIARRTPRVDTSRIILMGSSKGGELVLNLASRFNQFKGVVALSTSHVSFPAITISANTSSWQYNDEEVIYVPAPFKTIVPAIKGDLYGAFSMMLEDEGAVTQAEIKVERINGPILMLSGTEDDQWPSAEMSEQIVSRLTKNKFNHRYQHLSFAGGHLEPLNHFDEVFVFLDSEFKK